MSSKSRVVDRDLGYKDILKVIEELGEHAYVDVGFFEEGPGSRKHPRTGKTVAEYSAINEFGDGKGTPARPHHREAFDKNAREYTRAINRAVNKALVGTQGSAHRALKEVAQKASENLEAAIRNKETPENAPMTIRRKGFDDPLIETGQMAESVDTRTSWEKK